MADERQNGEGLTRRRFFGNLGRRISLVVLGGGLAAGLWRRPGKEMVWQLDPFKCIQCGKCAVNCVLPVSAVKCVHDLPMCGYCRLCFGFFQTNPIALDEGAENQMCPTGAIQRRYVEDPYHEYTIDETLCIGCGKCVKGCNAFGNGSIYLQVRHDRCLNCNECRIAAHCPADAFSRVPADEPYFTKSLGPDQYKQPPKRKSGEAGR